MQTITTWTADALSRFDRFLRLWRRLGCAIPDLDKALCDPRVGNGRTDGAALAALARLHDLGNRTAITWDELLGLWSPVDRFGYLDVLGEREERRPSVYERRFRNPTVWSSSTVFVADPDALAGPLGSPEALAGISAALGISSEDLHRIRAAADLDNAAAALDLTNLGKVFRYPVLASALRLSIAELLIAIDVCGIDPFTGPAATLALIDALDRARRSGFSLLELHYLLHHGSPLESGLAVADSTIAGWLDDLRRGLARNGAAAEDLIVQRIGDLVSLDPALLRQLLSTALPGAGATLAALFADPRLVQRAADRSFAISSDRAAFAPIFDWFVVLHKLRTVIARWRISTRDATWLLAHAGELGWLALPALPAGPGAPVAFADLATLGRVVAMQQALAADDESRLFDVAARRTAPRDEVAAALAALGGWHAGDVTALADRFGWTTGASLVAGAAAPDLRDLLPWTRRLGTNVPTLLGFVTTDLDAAHARQARQLAKARHDLPRWYEIAAVIQDQLREEKRAALVAWLLAHPSAARQQRWTDVEELYGHYLIDPEMTAVAMTTRIKQAAASVQLFVQRCFLQREPAVVVDDATDSGWREWAWMKRFRMWEANRKIFLYPENWIDPSHRRGKSPFFAELEAELQQGEMTHAAAEDALVTYLHKLSDVANLEICGTCEQLDYGQRLHHVIGRTRKTPHVHYYRRLGSTGVWSPWEKLDLEIDAEQVMPVYWNRRLYVFWPVLERKAFPSSPADRAVPAAGGGTSPAPAQYWEIGLAWVEKRRERWMPKRQSMHRQLAAAVGERGITLKALTTRRRLTVELYLHRTHYAQWQLATADAEPVLLHVGLTNAMLGLDESAAIGPLPPAARRPLLLTSGTTSWRANALAGGSPGAAGPLSLLEGQPLADLTVLSRIRQPRVMVDHQALQFTSQAPFFLSDPQRTYFVRPSFVATTVSRSGAQPSGSTTFTTQYTPEIFYHPFVDTFVQELAYGGVDALYRRRLQLEPSAVRGATFDFGAEYLPTAAIVRRPEPTPYPVETIDYSHGGAYAAYNWELFFHLPFLVARRLADNQRFDEALRWFHYVFDPNATTGGASPQRYWIPRVLHELADADYARQQIERLLQLVNQGDPELARKIAEWRADPFDPHLIAASRPVAYQKAIVMRYIDTLIAWGDQLFRADTIESINEATQLYLLAGQLLGPRPQHLRALAPREPRTYDELAPALDAFGNAMVEIENVISVPAPMAGAGGAPLPQLHTFYFCIPPNEHLLGYWDAVADRLFKIRHGLNLDGVARPLPLYEPPIDPGLLARAAAAGVELSTVLADVQVGQPCYRFQILWQAAIDLCHDVRALGGAILGALERRDAEALARLQSTQERALLEALRAVKQDQLAEARAQRDALVTARTMAVLRRDYYGSRELLNPAEAAGLALGGAAIATETAATVLELVAAAAHAFPSVTFGGAGFGGSPLATVTTGGESAGRVAASAAAALRGVSSVLVHGAGLAGTVGGYQRRRDDWDLQRRVADKEIVQVDRQLLAAELRIAYAQHELEVHDRQRDHAANVAEHLTSKFTSRELYDWCVAQLSTTYFQAYQLAYDLAKRASKAYAFELGAEPGYVQFGYWDSLHKGLHAGDRLLVDLRRLHADFLDHHRRELELTKHVSLVQLDPLALVRLRRTGSCFIDLPEAVFDRDQPGHYLRRIKSVAITLPGVTGPYTTINATLTLVGHAVRHAAEPGAQYLPAVDADGLPVASDPRFWRSTATVPPLALSTGREDTGLFEVNLRDERYLPFEGLGAISHWRLELPLDTNRWDVSTLADVIVHLRYTARDGGQPLRDAARAAVVAATPRAGVQLLAARSQLPDAWARMWAPGAAGQTLVVELGDRHFPYHRPDLAVRVTGVSALLALRTEAAYAAYAAAAPLPVRLGFATADGTPPSTGAPLAADPGLGGLPVATIALVGAAAPLVVAFLEADLATHPVVARVETDPDGTVHHRLDPALVDDIFVLVRYELEAPQ